MAHDGVHEQWVVRAAEYDGVDGWVAPHEAVDAFLHEVVGTGAVGFVGLHDGSPQRTRLAGDGDVGKELPYLHGVAVGAYGAFCGEYADVA